MNKFDFRGNRWRQINAFIPHYNLDGGNGTLIFLPGGETINDNRKTVSFVKGLARHLARDLTAARSRSAELLGRNAQVPLYLHRDLILVPVRARRPQSKDQGAWGHLVRSQVASCRPAQDGGTTVTFIDGSLMNCLQKCASVDQGLLLAERLAGLWEEDQVPGGTMMVAETLSTYNYHQKIYPPCQCPCCNCGAMFAYLSNRQERRRHLPLREDIE